MDHIFVVVFVGLLVVVVATEYGISQVDADLCEDLVTDIAGDVCCEPTSMKRSFLPPGVEDEEVEAEAMMTCCGPRTRLDV